MPPHCKNKIIYTHKSKFLPSYHTKLTNNINDKKMYPFMFVDKSPSLPLPPATFLNLFKVVLTSTERLSKGWKAGNNSNIEKNNGSKVRYAFDSSSSSSNVHHSPLLDIYWLRVVVDEGHFFAKTHVSNSIQFAGWISARSRWACTGTPTPQTANRSALPAVLGLLHFLQHEYFSPLNDNFQTLIGRPFASNDPTAFFKLRALLVLLMVRHTKLEIAEIPKPTFTVAKMKMSETEMCAYNTIATTARMNLVLTSMEGKTSGEQDSLLVHFRRAREVLRNIRLACCGGQ